MEEIDNDEFCITPKGVVFLSLIDELENLGYNALASNHAVLLDIAEATLERIHSVCRRVTSDLEGIPAIVLWRAYDALGLLHDGTRWIQFLPSASLHLEPCRAWAW